MKKKNEITDNEIYRILTNNELMDVLYKNKNGDIIDENGTLITNINDDDADEKIDEFEEKWREINWSDNDWANYYCCNDDEINECFLDDIGY